MADRAAVRAETPAQAEDREVATFAETFFQDVLVRAETAGGEDYLENEFTRAMLETLADAGEIEDEWGVAFHRSRGMKANGYGLAGEGDTLVLVYSEFTGESPPPSVTRTAIETGFRRLRTFLAKALAGELDNLEEASTGFEMVDQIRAWRPLLERARLYLLTDGLTPGEPVADAEVGGLAVTHHVWDIRRTYRCLTSGQQREPVDVDFAALSCGPLPFLKMPASSDEYAAYLLMIPGDALAAIYERYGTRLLERNVRAFLQARGKVNKGIRETIVKAPHRFLAYNNGISATGADVTVAKRADGTLGIARVRDFQIVNGGQTTASIFHAQRKDRADVSAVAVQAKLSVVEPTMLAELVPVISRFANSQNKVSEADFSANDTFHVALEGISRTLWTPPRPGQQRQTRWFYERARGQYADALSRAGTPAQQRQFKQTHPAQQRFTKTDLAKYENSWLQYPHFVGRGAEKNFREFTLQLKERGGSTLVTEDFFRHLVAKAILFRETERVVTEFEFGGYRSQIVTYTVARLSHATAMRLDLDAIWRSQALSADMTAAVQVIAPVVHASITAPPSGQNIAEWCKKEDCWKRVRELAVTLPSGLESSATHAGTALAVPVSDEAALQIAEVAAVPATVWYAISGWAKETNNLQGWQRGIAYTLGQYATRGKQPSPKQAHHGVIILAEARRLGFRDDTAVAS